MDIKYSQITDAAIVNLESLGFGPFSVVIFPESNNEYTFYLRHKQYCIIKYMFTCTVDNMEEAAEMAHSNALEYIPEFIEECIP